jgi:hypothetical protein
MVSTTPIALMKTSKLVDPAKIKGNGNPVGGIEPVNTSYCIIKFYCKYEKFFSLYLYILEYANHNFLIKFSFLSS